MNKHYISLVLAILALCLPGLAMAGTCNASYTDTLPQTSGSIGSLPPNTPGQTPLGQITHIEATGGTSISFTFTPTSGSPVTSSINFGASSGIICTSGQAGGWSGSSVYGLKWDNTIGGGNNTYLVINNSTAPDHVVVCQGMQSDSPMDTFSSTFTLQKVWAGSDPQQLNFAGYDTNLGKVGTISLDMNGSCRFGSSYYGQSFQNPQITTDTSNWPHMVATGTPGATSVAFYLDGVSAGSDSSAPYDIIPTAAPGPHTLYVLATFPLGTVKAYGYSVSYKPYDIAAGYNFSCATTQPYGELYCWGSNNYGQLGAGSAASSSSSPLGVSTSTLTPYPGSGPVGEIYDVSAGMDCACAVWNGGVICWGRNVGGVLGVSPGTLSSSNTPLTVIAPQSGVKNVSVGANFACALYNNGDVKCWGYGAYGQLGNGSFGSTNITPTTVMTGVTKVLAARDTTFFQKGSDVWTTGRDNYGQLGDGGGSVSISTPVKIITGGVSDLWSGWYHACARVSGTIKCWGANQTGEGGIGTAPSNLYSPTTTTVWGSNPYITTMGGGDGTTCAYFQVGSALQCIGYNTSGQLGMGYTSSYELSVKTPTAYLSGVGINPTNGIYSGGWTHICAFDDGHYKCAGDNTYGQIGNPSASNPQLTPYTVLGM